MPSHYRMRLVPAALLTSSLLGCGSGPSAFEGTYELALVGTRTPREVAAADHCFTPTSAAFAFRSGRWVSSDTYAFSPKCRSEMTDEARKELEGVRTDSGHYRLFGDTVRLFVSDTTIGERGLVNVGFRRGDTLLFLGSDMEPGDWFYVRRR